MTNTMTTQPMYQHLFLACAKVNSSERNQQRRAARQGVTTLAEYHAWKRNH